MIIFSLLDTPAYGGAEAYLLSVLFHAASVGHRVVLATNNSQVKEKAKLKIEVIDLPYRLDAIGNWKGLLKYFLALPGAIFWICTKLKVIKPNICLFPGFTDRLSFSPIVGMFGCRLVWLEYGPLEPTFARNFGFPKLLYAIGKPFPDQIVTISQWTKRSLVSKGKISADKIKIIYPGVETERKREKVKRTEIFTVITVARLAKEKEIDVLIQAWAQVNRKNKKLIIIGDGPERKPLEQLAKNLWVQDTIAFVGFASELEKHRLLRQADLFVFPSAWPLEGFGMTTAEAMLSGVPVITTGFGPQAELVEDGETGWYFRARDARDLAMKIEAVQKSPEREKVARRGMDFAITHFSYKRCIVTWEQLLQSESRSR